MDRHRSKRSMWLRPTVAAFALIVAAPAAGAAQVSDGLRCAAQERASEIRSRGPDVADQTQGGPDVGRTL